MKHVLFDTRQVSRERYPTQRMRAHLFRSDTVTSANGKSKSVCSKDTVIGEVEKRYEIMRPNRLAFLTCELTTKTTTTPATHALAPALAPSTTATPTLTITRAKLNNALVHSVSPSGERFMIVLVTCIALCSVMIPSCSATHGFSLALDDFDRQTLPDQSQPIEQAAGMIPSFIDPRDCQWTESKRSPSEVELLIMTLRCDIKPLIEILLDLESKMFGRNHRVTTAGELSRFFGNDQHEYIWREFLILHERADFLYEEAMFVLRRKQFCTYSNIARLQKLKIYLMISPLLMNLYDVVSIEFHQSCLIHSLYKLPQVPHVVKSVVGVYVGGQDKPVAGLLEGQDFPLNKLNPVRGDGDGFNIDRAIKKSGQLNEVLMLNLDLSVETSNLEKRFRDACKDFLVELEERWQSMDMMNNMISTDANGIMRYNNYVLRMLNPTKYADICTRL